MASVLLQSLTQLSGGVRHSCTSCVAVLARENEELMSNANAPVRCAVCFRRAGAHMALASTPAG